MILFNCFTSKINRLLLNYLVWTFTREMTHAIMKWGTIEKKTCGKTDKGRRFFLKLPRLAFSRLISNGYFQMVWEKKILVGHFVSIMKLCKWSYCQPEILPSAMKNSAIFFTFYFTHCSSYQKDKTVLGTAKASVDVFLEKTALISSPNHFSPAKLICLILRKANTYI